MDQFSIIEKGIKRGVRDPDQAGFYLITGSAGSGKTTLLKKFNKAFEKSAILAPTGVAALNCGGVTIHSFLKIGTKLTLKKMALGKNVTGEYKKVFENLELLIIDEISFVSAPLLDGLSASLKKIRRSKAQFGGITVVASGDLLQLPPVIKAEDKKQLKDLGYKSKYFFHSNVFKEILKKDGLNYFRLPVNYRQQSDQKYLRLLNKIREISDIKGVIKEFNQNCLNNKISNPIVLSPWKKNVHEVNQTKLNGLKGIIKNFSAKTRTGQFDIFRSKDEQLPASPELKLKIGAKVVMVKNDLNYHKRWVNGSTGVITDLSDKDVIKINIDGYNRNVEREKWEHYKHEYDEKTDHMTQKLNGIYEQFPVALGWAFTIHKSQGLTLDNCQIDMRGGNAFEHGMMYVALSRCRNLKDISFTRELELKDFKFDKEVVEFQKYLNKLSTAIAIDDDADESDSNLNQEITLNYDDTRIHNNILGRLDNLESLIKGLENRVDSLESNTLNVVSQGNNNAKNQSHTITDEELFELLRKERAVIADEEGNPAYTIAPNRTLEELSEVRPTTIEDLYDIYGLAEARIKKYGQRFLNIIGENR